MQSQFVVTSLNAAPTPPSSETPAGLAELLRQILDVQRAQLAQMQAAAAAHDASARWRALLARWREDFPELPDACRQALPILEKAYGSIISALVDELRHNGGEAFESEFSLQDFLDRYGMRLGQLGTILNLVGPLAEAASQNEQA